MTQGHMGTSCLCPRQQQGAASHRPIILMEKSSHFFYKLVSPCFILTKAVCVPSSVSILSHPWVVLSTASTRDRCEQSQDVFSRSGLYRISELGPSGQGSDTALSCTLWLGLSLWPGSHGTCTFEACHQQTWNWSSDIQCGLSLVLVLPFMYEPM